MSCSACIKKRDFDIVVSHNGCEYLVLEDRSVWVNKDGTKPDSYEVVISIPSRNREVTVNVKTEGKTYLTSKELYGSKDIICLQDDILCFKVTSCGYDLKINRAFVCNLEVKLNELIYKFADNMSTDNRKVILDLKLLLESVKINSTKGNAELSKKLFNSAKEKLKAYHCENC